MMQYFLRFAVDLSYVALAAIIIVVFASRGLIDSIYRFGRGIFAGAASFLLGPSLSDLLYHKLIYQNVHDYVYEKSDQLLTDATGSVDLEALINELPFLVKQLVDRGSLEQKLDSMSGDLHAKVGDFSVFVSEPISWLLSNLIAYTVVFFAALVVLFLLFKLLERIFEIPTLDKINKILGGIFGVASAVLVLAAITFVLGVVVSIIGAESTIREMTDSSYLYRFFNYISIFDLF